MKRFPPRCFICILLTVSLASAVEQIAPSFAPQMTATANRFLESLTAEQRSRISLSFDDAKRLNWHYVPRDRAGHLRYLTTGH